MTRMEHARQLRASETPHYNCCQSVLVPFAKEMGLTEEQAYALGAHFGGGMHHGSTCGAVTGALMVLGAAGRDGAQAAALLRQFRQERGSLFCPELLKGAKERGEVTHDHCSGLVYDVVARLDALLADG